MKKFTKIFEQKDISNDDIQNILIDVLDNGSKIHIRNIFICEGATDIVCAKLKSQEDRIGKLITIDIKNIQKKKLQFALNRYEDTLTTFFTDINKISNIVESVIDYIEYFEGYQKNIHIGNDKIDILLIGDKYNSPGVKSLIKKHTEFIFPKLVEILNSESFKNYKTHFKLKTKINITNTIVIENEDHAAYAFIFVLNEYMTGDMANRVMSNMEDMKGNAKIISDYMKEYNLSISFVKVSETNLKLVVDLYRHD